MTSSRGIFEPQEGFAPAPAPKSPFALPGDDKASPFAVVPDAESPFATMKDDLPARLTPEAGRPARLPERRDPAPAEAARSPFGQEQAFGTSPFEAAPAASPFAAAPASAPAPASPFSFTAEAAPAQLATPVQAAQPPHQGFHVQQQPAAPVQAVPAYQAAEASSFESDSHSIRQLELRAIFGVDRELSADEILQRSRSLPGIRHVARLAAQDAGVLDGLKRLVGGLGFGNGQVKLYSGSAPIDFIRENNVILAVQTDGGFAPGVRETLMIVARELGRL